MYRSSPASRLLKIGGLVRYYSIASKALLHSSIQSNVWASCKVVRKLWSLSMNQAINRPKAARRLISRYISFLLDRMGILNTNFTWFRFISIPCWVTKKPRNLHVLSPNTHLSGLSFILYFCIRLNTSSKCWTCFARVLLLTTWFMPSWVFIKTFIKPTTPYTRVAKTKLLLHSGSRIVHRDGFSLYT